MPAVEVLWSALAFLGCTSGGILACLGGHIDDQVPISGRWAGPATAGRQAPELSEGINDRCGVG